MCGLQAGAAPGQVALTLTLSGLSREAARQVFQDVTFPWRPP